MEFLFDTANLAEIEKYGAIFPFTGVTSNPSILKAEGRIDLFARMREIRACIGLERTLHIQVVAQDYTGMLRDADAILERVDSAVYIKIPVTEEGLKAMRALKARGVGVTATAVYSKAQGFMAIACGADFLAPYYNRMENLDICARETVAALRQMIDSTGAQTKILAASFKNMAQVNASLLAGAHAATVQPALLHEAFGFAALQKAVDDFTADWAGIHGDCSLADLTNGANSTISG